MKGSYLKNILTAFIFSFLFFNELVNAQTITWSQPLTDEKKMQYMKIIGTDDDGFYILRSNFSFEYEKDHSGFRSRKYALGYVDFDMHQKWNQQLTASLPDARITSVLSFNNRILVISSITEKQTKSYRIYAQYMNSKGAYEGQAMLVDSLVGEKINDDNKPDVVVSGNQSKLACAFRKVSVDNKDEQSYHTIVVDTALNILYKKEIQIPVNAKFFTPVNFTLSDRGNFYLLGIYYATEKKVKAPNESYYRLYSYDSSLDRVTSNEIKIEDKFLTDVGISADNLNRKIVVAGFYSDKTTYSTAGIFYFSMNEDATSQTVRKSSAFSPEFLSKFLGERKENNNKELVNYSIDRLILRKDGGAAVLAESYIESTSSYWDYYMQTYVSRHYYHFGNIIVLSVNPDGSILWGNSITKDQNSTDDAGYLSSYCAAITGGKIYSIYNKYIEEESSVLMTTVDAIGKQKTDVLFNELKNVSIVPRSAKQIDSETLLLPAYRENKFYILKVEF